MAMAVLEFTPLLPQAHHLSSSCGHSHTVLVFPIQCYPPVPGRRLSSSIFFSGRTSPENHAPPYGGSIFFSSRTSPENHALPNGGKKANVEKLWMEFFSDPSEWRDHRMGKINPKFPDFIHKKTQEGLWVDSQWIPLWVEAELAAIQPGPLELATFSWNQRLSRCVKAGQYQETLQLFEQMQREGMNSDTFTFVPVLNACARLGFLEDGRRIHTQIIENGFDTNIYVGNSLVDMYAKCGSIVDAERVFNEMPKRSVVTWNAMIVGYVKCGQGRHALELFRQMQWEGVNPVSITFVGVLNACASVAALEEGRCAHEDIIQRGFESDVYVGSSLVHMYAKCGSIEDAERVFKDMPTRGVVAWNAMVLGYVQCCEGQKALELFGQMQQEGVDPDSVTFVAVLNACASVPALEEGKLAHQQIIQRGYESDVFVGNSLIDMYAKCGSIEDAERVFEDMPTRDVVAWNAMVLGYVQCREGQKALELFGQMQQEGVDPDCVTFMAVLNACASVAALEEGRRAHKQIIQRGYESDVYVGNKLIDMYAKCGSIDDAERVFMAMPKRNVVSWNAMLAGYGWHGCTERALEHFKQMCKCVEVNDVTFSSLLSACSHGGLVDEGLKFFKSMSAVYRISPTAVHYACVIDLLGRAGRLHEADDMIRSLPAKASAAVWKSLLGACRVHGNVEMGEWSAKQVVELDPENAAGYVLLSNIYAAAGERNKSVRVTEERLDRGVEKTPGGKCIEVNNEVHLAVLDDSKHPQMWKSMQN